MDLSIDDKDRSKESYMWNNQIDRDVDLKSSSLLEFKINILREKLI